ncbi:uncharacterized protein DS421_2g59060 [Arachis hypogaea]|nr:uncharacterized protein DS421_2g59060 [Arachis hypogaea]
MAAGPTDRAAPAAAPLHNHLHSPPAAPLIVPDSFAKDAILAWFRGEFAAANAIIDALCAHLAQLSSVSGDDGRYDALFSAVHRRRLNWIPVLQMQKYHSIADVALELRNVTDREKNIAGENAAGEIADEKEKIGEEKVTEIEENGGEHNEEYESPKSEITDSGKLRLKAAFGYKLN